MGSMPSDQTNVAGSGRQPAALAMREIQESMGQAWDAERESHPGINDEAAARGVVEHPSRHPWEQETLLLAARRGVEVDGTGVRSFSELRARAEAAMAGSRGGSR